MIFTGTRTVNIEFVQVNIYVGILEDNFGHFTDETKTIMLECTIILISPLSCA